MPFVQKITVSIVLCPQKKPAPPPPPVPGPPVIGPVIPKSVFEGKTYYVTLHISLDGSKVALINVKLANSNSTVASASYDPASQTVSGVGLEDGTATITVTGSAQGASLNVPFSQDIKVTVTDRPGAEEDEP
ncbi:MAG TPA: hypothetical protein VGW33_04775 [Terriglobia bacterium]|nr:hypothetical protein [Terriglobia bacterium]